MKQNLKDYLGRIAGAICRALLTVFALGIISIIGAVLSESFAEKGLHLPRFVFAYRDTVLAGGSLIMKSLKESAGWYLTIFGICSAVCEIAATARRQKYREVLNQQFAKAFSLTLNLLGTAFALTCVIWIFTFLGRDHGTATNLYLKTHPSAMDLDFWTRTKEVAIFGYTYKLFIAEVLTFALWGCILTLAACVIAYGVGFAGIMTALMSLSHWIAKMFHIEDAASPIASLLLAILGIILTLTL